MVSTTAWVIGSTSMFTRLLSDLLPMVVLSRSTGTSLRRMSWMSPSPRSTPTTCGWTSKSVFSEPMRAEDVTVAYRVQYAASASHCQSSVLEGHPQPSSEDFVFHAAVMRRQWGMSGNPVPSLVTTYPSWSITSRS